MKKYSVIFLLAILGFACNDEGEEIIENQNANVINKDAVEAVIADIVDGTVGEIEEEKEQGVDALKVEVTAADGAELEFYLAKADNSLLRIDGENGPFTYQLNPGNDVISFNEAKSIAENASPGDLEKWRLKQDSYGAWFYRMEMSDEKVEIDGASGNLRQASAGDSDDDDDYDGDDYYSGGDDYYGNSDY